MGKDIYLSFVHLPFVKIAGKNNSKSVTKNLSGK